MPGSRRAGRFDNFVPGPQYWLFSRGGRVLGKASTRLEKLDLTSPSRAESSRIFRADSTFLELARQKLSRLDGYMTFS